MDTVYNNRLALKYYDAWRAEVIANKESHDKRMAQIVHLINENKQLKNELEDSRMLVDKLLYSGDNWVDSSKSKVQ